MRIIVCLLAILLSLTACAGEVTLTETTTTTETVTETQTESVTQTQTQTIIQTKTVTAITLTEEPEPIEVVTMVGPIKPYNPGGPTIEITLKNITAEPIVYLTATLELSSRPLPYIFTFDVTPSNPLLPYQSISKRQTLIGGGIWGGTFYPLKIELIFQSQPDFVYIFSTQVQITTPVE